MFTDGQNISLNDANVLIAVSGLLADIVAAGLMTQAQASVALYVLDTTWTQYEFERSWGRVNLSCWLETSDVTAAKAS